MTLRDYAAVPPVRSIRKRRPSGWMSQVAVVPLKLRMPGSEKSLTGAPRWKPGPSLIAVANTSPARSGRTPRGHPAPKRLDTAPAEMATGPSPHPGTAGRKSRWCRTPRKRRRAIGRSAKASCRMHRTVTGAESSTSDSGPDDQLSVGVPARSHRRGTVNSPIERRRLRRRCSSADRRPRAASRQPAGADRPATVARPARNAPRGRPVSTRPTALPSPRTIRRESARRPLVYPTSPRTRRRTRAACRPAICAGCDNGLPHAMLSTDVTPRRASTRTQADIAVGAR